jgi:hypothetical protein
MTARMSVPEAAVHLYCKRASRQDDVWFPREIAAVRLEAEAHRAKHPGHGALRQRVFTPDRSHIAAAHSARTLPPFRFPQLPHDSNPASAAATATRSGSRRTGGRISKARQCAWVAKGVPRAAAGFPLGNQSSSAEAAPALHGIRYITAVRLSFICDVADSMGIVRCLVRD